MIKNDKLYPYYVSWIQDKQLKNRISYGALNLLKLSTSAFEDFRNQYTKNFRFHQLVNDLHKVEIRDEKIADILNGTN